LLLLEHALLQGLEFVAVVEPQQSEDNPSSSLLIDPGKKLLSATATLFHPAPQNGFGQEICSVTRSCMQFLTLCHALGCSSCNQLQLPSLSSCSLAEELLLTYAGHALLLLCAAFYLGFRAGYL
jgi:hypothetical protein